MPSIFAHQLAQVQVADCRTVIIAYFVLHSNWVAPIHKARVLRLAVKWISVNVTQSPSVLLDCDRRPVRMHVRVWHSIVGMEVCSVSYGQ